MTDAIGSGGAFHRSTLRFLDTSLEEAYQREEGATGLAGFRIITGATVILWLAAALIIPVSTAIPPGLARTVGVLMALAGAVCLALSTRTVTMNSQHAIASMLTSANGVVLILLTSAAGAFQGYAVGGIVLLYLFGFASRTRFVHATVRTLVIGAAFAVVVVVSEDTDALLIDAFLLLAASGASLLGLRLIEVNRRQVWYQRRVIEQQSAEIRAERAESERLLLNILPQAVSERLKNGESPIADDFPEVSVLFADIVGFTPMTARMTAREVISLLSGLFTHFDDLVFDLKVEKIKTIGDAYMAVAGLPEPDANHAHHMVELGRAMVASTGGEGLLGDVAIRVGIHSGPVAGGVIGSRKFAYDVWGETVNIAARLEQAGQPGRVHVSERTMSLTSDSFSYEPVGPTDLRGIGLMTTYLLGIAVGESAI